MTALPTGPEIMRAVNAALRPLVWPQGLPIHPEGDDLLSEGYLAAWRQISRLGEDCPYSWRTVASKAARWAAGQYLRERRSGRITGRWSECVYPERLEDLAWEEEPGDDGGIGAAEARALLAMHPPRLTEKQALVMHLFYAEGLGFSEIGRRLGIQWATAREHRDAALRKYRRALAVECCQAEKKEKRYED